MWTKLLNCTFHDAFKPCLVKGKWHRPILSGRYKNMLKKQFRIQGVPWLFEKKLDISKNPRNKKPKGHKHQLNKPERVEKIMKNIENYSEIENKYRQERLNNRKYSGMDLLVQKTIPSFLSKREAKIEEVKGSEDNRAILSDVKEKSFGKRAQKKLEKD